MTARRSACVQLRDIVTDEDRAAAVRVSRGPGQDQFVSSVEESFEDAVRNPQGHPRYWSAWDDDEVVGFAMISDGIPDDELAANPLLLGPFFLWRLLVDAPRQRGGYGTSILDAVVKHVRGRGGRVLYVSCVDEPGGPRPFYERYGFVSEDRIIEEELVLRLDLEDRAGSPSPATTLPA